MIERKTQGATASIKQRHAASAAVQRRATTPAPSPASTLRNVFGNRATQRSMAGPAPAASNLPAGGAIQQSSGCHAAPFQRKPTVSAPDDPLERQADIVADQIMRMPARNVVHRVCKECEEEKEKPVRIHRATSADSGAGLDVSGAVSATQRSGAPLPADVRSFFEPRFGHDFSGVRLHTDGEAARAARGTEARAYTIGRDIVFGSNQYAPHTAEGRRLLAHELAHVVQQGEGGPPGTVQRRALTPAERTAAIAANRALFNSLSVRVLQTITAVPAANRDGIIGPQTVRAISDWQSARGLVDNGIVNEASMDRLVTESLAANRAEHGIQLVLDFFNLNASADTLTVRHRSGAFTFEGLRLFLGFLPVPDISPAATAFEEGNLRVIEVGDPAFVSARTLRDTIQRELARAGPARPPAGATPARLNAVQVRAAVRFTASKYSDQRSVRAIQGLVGAPVTGIVDATTVQFIAEAQHTAGLTADGKVGIATTENFYNAMVRRGNPNSALRLLVDFFDLRDQGNLLSIFFDPTLTLPDLAATDFRPSQPVTMQIGPGALALPFAAAVHTIAHEMEHVRRLREGIASANTHEFLGEAVEILSVGMPEEPLGVGGDGLFISDATRCLDNWNLMPAADRRRFRNKFIAVRRKVLQRIDAGTAAQRIANAGLRARYVAVVLP